MSKATALHERNMERIRKALEGPTAEELAEADLSGRRTGDLTNQVQQAYQEAKKKNEQRYQKILEGYRDRTGDVMGLLKGIGQQAEADIMERGLRNRAKRREQLISSGLAGTTILPSVMQGEREATDRSLSRHADRLARSKAQTLSGLRGETLGFMERRKDTYPDVGSYADLMRRLGKNQETAETPVREPTRPELPEPTQPPESRRRRPPRRTRQEQQSGGEFTEEEVNQQLRNRGIDPYPGRVDVQPWELQTGAEKGMREWMNDVQYERSTGLDPLGESFTVPEEPAAAPPTTDELLMPDLKPDVLRPLDPANMPDQEERKQYRRERLNNSFPALA